MTVWKPDQAEPDAPLRRYVNLFKFESMLIDKALFLPTLETLRTIDKMEGLFLPEALRTSVDDEAKKFGADPPTDADHEVLRRSAHITMEREKAWALISCWHNDDDESQAMWHMYKADVMLCSTVQRLTTCFLEGNEFSPVFGLVHYIRHGREFVPTQNLRQPMFIKDKSLEHEKEFRVIFRVPGARAKGLPIKVDIEKLIEGVAVSPYPDKSQRDIVRDLLDKYGFGKIPVEDSRLRTVPESL
jgi:hypothetical protein